MEKEKLQSYIRRSIRSGINPDEITQQLRDAGWSEGIINETSALVQQTIKSSKPTLSTEHFSPELAAAGSAHSPKSNNQTAPISALDPNKVSPGGIDPNDRQNSTNQPHYEATGKRRNRFKTTWLLFKQTFNLLWYNKGLFRYPFTGAIFVMLVGAVLLTLVISLFNYLEAARIISNTGMEIINFTFLFIYYVIAMFIIFIYNSALTAHLLELFRGESRTHKDYLSIAWDKKGPIFFYSAISATVGLIFRLIERIFKDIGRIMTRILGLGWHLANLFTLAIIVEGNGNAPSAIRSSVRLFKERWGENVMAGTSFYLLAWLLYTVAWYFSCTAIYYTLMMFGLLDNMQSFFDMFGFGVAIFLLLSLYLLPFITIERTLTNTLNTVLYYYAKTGKTPAEFDPELLNSSLRQRNRLFRK